jgi:hypothetical protein
LLYFIPGGKDEQNNLSQNREEISTISEPIDNSIKESFTGGLENQNAFRYLTSFKKLRTRSFRRRQYKCHYLSNDNCYNCAG